MIQRLVLIILLLCPMALLAQSGAFVIKGKMGELNDPAKVFLTYRTEDGVDMKDSCTLVNGQFELKGYVANPINSALLYLKRFPKDDNMMQIWIEPGTMYINGTDFLRTATIKGSQINMDVQKLEVVMKPIVERMQKLNREDKDFRKKYDEMQKERIAVLRDFIVSNPNSILSVWELWRSYGPLKYNNKRGIEEVEPMFNNFSDAVKNSKLGKQYKAQLEEWEIVGLGKMAPDFTLFDQENKAVKLSNFKGKYVLVDFWASWCHPCREENPNLIGQYQLYKDKNFTILGVSIDTEKEWPNWLKAINDDGLTWPQVVGKVRDNEARLNFHVQGIPDNFLISPDGVILAKGLRGEELNEKLKEILSK